MPAETVGEGLREGDEGTGRGGGGEEGVVAALAVVGPVARAIAADAVGCGGGVGGGEADGPGGDVAGFETGILEEVCGEGAVDI